MKQNLTLKAKIEMATKLATFDAIEKSSTIKNIELRKKLIVKYVSTENFKKSADAYLKLLE